MTDTFPARIRQAIADPSSIVPRMAELRNDGLPETGYEPLNDWTARAVLQVIVEHRYDIDTDSGGTANPVFVAVALAFYGLLLLVAGLWLGSVWL